MIHYSPNMVALIAMIVFQTQKEIDKMPHFGVCAKTLDNIHKAYVSSQHAGLPVAGDLWDVLNKAYDICGVEAISREMLGKLGQKRTNGRGGWFMEECTIDDLKKMLAEHVEKGDMVDIANFAMMIWNRQRMDNVEQGRMDND